MSIDFTNGNITHAVDNNSLSTSSFTFTCFIYLPISAPAFGWTLFSIDNGTVFIQLASSSNPLAKQVGAWSSSHSGGHLGVQLFSQSLLENTWAFLALVGAPTTSSVYWSIANGALQSATIETPSDGATTVWISNDGVFGNDNFPGFVSGVKIWPFGLTSDQILVESTSLIPFMPGVWATYPLIDAPTANIDTSGNLRNASVTGTLTTSKLFPPWVILPAFGPSNPWISMGIIPF